MLVINGYYHIRVVRVKLVRKNWVQISKCMPKHDSKPEYKKGKKSIV